MMVIVVAVGVLVVVAAASFSREIGEIDGR